MPPSPADRTRARLQAAVLKILEDLPDGAPMPQRVAVTVGPWFCLLSVGELGARMPILTDFPVAPPEGAHELSECERLVVALLRDLRGPYTAGRIHELLAARSTPVGRSTLDRALARLCSIGVVANPRDRLGYRLPPASLPADPAAT
jgi:hypothetical protein